METLCILVPDEMTSTPLTLLQALLTAVSVFQTGDNN
jgi:hypothetical protein